MIGFHFIDNRGVPVRKSIITVAVLALSPLVITGCATTKQHASQHVPDSVQFVDAKVSGSAASIYETNKLLLKLTQGKPDVRHAEHLGSTVAGKVIETTQPLKASEDPLPGTPSYEALKAQNRLLLQKKINITWQGSPEEALKQLAQVSGYRVLPTSGSASELHSVALKGQGITVEQALRQVGEQVTKKATVHVKTSDKTFQLVIR